jgi:hypothetical protein
MSGISANVRKQAERATLELPFTIPAKEWLTLRECGGLCGMSESFVEKVYDAGKSLSGHNYNAGKKAARETKRVPRVWFITWMISTAQYDDASLGDALLACLPKLPAVTLHRIASAATKLANEKPLQR